MSSQPDYETRRKQESERKRLKVLQEAGYCFAERGFRKGKTVLAHQLRVSENINSQLD